jgi:hypothetical protein
MRLHHLASPHLLSVVAFCLDDSPYTTSMMTEVICYVCSLCDKYETLYRFAHSDVICMLEVKTYCGLAGLYHVSADDILGL